MRRWLLLLTGLAVIAPAWCQDIVEVLERSQSVRLASMSYAEDQSPQAVVVHRSFDQLAQRFGSHKEMEVRVVTGSVIAECLLGRTIVANELLAEAPEAVRLFLLAHEIGHVVLGHWQQVEQLYVKYIPGEVIEHRTDAVAALLGREASQLSYAHELAADEFALHTLRSLGYDVEDVIGAFSRFGMQMDTATHPGTSKRIAHLRSIERDAVTADAEHPGG
ncbi:MAG TPA: M48 family metalloprotease [Burkholderiaceae bacterium]|nr:M48 family metalloprotease [Burkholderiaceae bacterium]